MSFTSPLPGSSGSSSSVNVSSLGGASAPIQITGLASGLNTNQIISELMSIDQQPLIHLQNQQKGLQALNSNLSSIQTSLQNLASSAQALSATTLFSNTQTVASSNPTLVAASTTGSVGAVVGGYQIAVSALASASQATYGFTSPTGADTVTVGNGTTSQTYNLSAGATAQDLANAVNADQNGSVWATVVNNNIVFSDRTTGSASTFTVSDSAGALVQQSSQAGTDAKYSTDGGNTWQTSSSNTVQNAIPGVTLTLAGLTTGGSPVTVNVSPPSISTSAIQNAVQSFISSYNSVLSQISTQLSQAPSSSDPTQGTLYGDPGLTSLLTSMRQAMYTGGAGLPAGMASMLDLGVSTGATTGTGTLNPNAVTGQLTLDANTLTQAITSNPSGVTAVLQSWSQSFASVVNAVAQPGGTIDSRVQGDDSQISDLGNQISTMQAALTDKQNQLQQQFANLEAALSQNQSTASWLTSQISSLPMP
ncbi:MAG TPA: flagellar filament capping protein FliD [Solirubrobacteraceae bacterium]|nr:flagellar filament capping protein FliD [Solirubrobacteraceae bacterium]